MLVAFLQPLVWGLLCMFAITVIYVQESILHVHVYGSIPGIVVAVAVAVAVVGGVAEEEEEEEVEAEEEVVGLPNPGHTTPPAPAMA